jgi:hypothetical protein
MRALRGHGAQDHKIILLTIGVVVVGWGLFAPIDSKAAEMARRPEELCPECDRPWSEHAPVRT